MTRPSKNLQAIVSSNVRRRRIAMKLSQEEFADLCGYHRTYIGAIERGERNITISTLEAIANALKCDAKELLVPHG